MEQQEFSFIAGGNAKYTASLEGTLAAFGVCACVCVCVVRKLNIIFSIRPNNHAPWYLPKGFENLDPQTHTHGCL